MSKKNLACFLFWLLIFSQIIVSNSPAQIHNLRYLNERFVIESLQTIHGAHMTYSATTGNGNYGSNLDLLEAEFIDEVLAGGSKYGYYFMFYKSLQTPTAPAKFHVTATPQNYGKAGKMSFYIDETGEIHGADRNGAAATANDPIVVLCAEYEYEKYAISNLRTIHSAQMTYQTSVGSGDFGTLNQLYKARLISRFTGGGFACGYSFTMTIRTRTSTSEAFFSVSAVPDKYGANSVKSFYLGSDGIIRGADKNGKPSDENDPPLINNF
jgi:hypothetical protein